jgi:hypothetical protein
VAGGEEGDEQDAQLLFAAAGSGRGHFLSRTLRVIDHELIQDARYSNVNLMDLRAKGLILI